MASRQHTATPTRRSDAITRLTIAAVALTILLTAIAFWLSYAALHDTAASHHVHDARGWAWPATLDTFIIVGETLILRSSLLRRVDWFAILLTAAGSIGSIALNVASVGNVDSLSQIVAAVPPVAALLAFTALMRQSHAALTGAAPPVATSNAPVDAAPAPAVTPPPLPQTAAITEASTPAAVPPMPAWNPASPIPAQPAYGDPRHEAIRRLYDNGTRPGTRQMQAAILAATGTRPSDSGARTLRQTVEAMEPHLARYPAAINGAA